MDPNETDSKSLSVIPRAPDDLSDEAAVFWVDVTVYLKNENRLFKHQLPKIEQLCRHHAKREQLIEELELRSSSREDDFESDPDYLHLTDPHEFDKRFDHYQTLYDSKVKAYEMVEFEHSLAFNNNKYSGYNSYRVARAGRIKNKK